MDKDDYSVFMVIGGIIGYFCFPLFAFLYSMIDSLCR